VLVGHGKAHGANEVQRRTRSRAGARYIARVLRDLGLMQNNMYVLHKGKFPFVVMPLL
jgi:hypothetical protein